MASEFPTEIGTFPTTLLRTGRAAFTASGSPATWTTKMTIPKSRYFCRDVEFRFGYLHHAYRTDLNIQSPVPLRPVSGFPARPGETSLSRLLWELRYRRTRVP